jgi:hypothetical protein
VIIKNKHKLTKDMYIEKSQAAVPPASAATRGKFKNIFVQRIFMRKFVVSHLPNVILFSI